MMCKGWMNPLIPESTRIKIAYDEITRLRAELAKVTWQRNEAQAGLAASRAELAHYVNRFGLWGGAVTPRKSKYHSHLGRSTRTGRRESELKA